jgi:hypothetical protein
MPVTDKIITAAITITIIIFAGLMNSSIVQGVDLFLVLRLMISEELGMIGVKIFI